MPEDGHSNGPSIIQNVPCERIATVQRSKGREMWIGRLDERVQGESDDGAPYDERYCLHIETPYQSSVFALDGTGDVNVFAIVAAVLNGWDAVDPKAIDHLLGQVETADEPILGQRSLIADNQNSATEAAGSSTSGNQEVGSGA